MGFTLFALVDIVDILTGLCGVGVGLVIVLVLVAIYRVSSALVSLSGMVETPQLPAWYQKP